MAKAKGKGYPQPVLDILAEKTAVLSKAQALVEMGMPETALALWASAASYEERLAPLLESLGKEREAAVHASTDTFLALRRRGEPSAVSVSWERHSESIRRTSRRVSSESGPASAARYKLAARLGSPAF